MERWSSTLLRMRGSAPVVVAAEEDDDRGDKDDNGDDDRVPPLPAAADEALLTSSLVAVLSRSFAMDAFEERIVPLLDVINHPDGTRPPSAVHRYDGEGNVVVTASGDVSDGEEIFCGYYRRSGAADDNDDRTEKGGGSGGGEGSMSGSRFFAKFGFLPAEFR